MTQDHWTAAEYRRFLETGKEPEPLHPKETFTSPEIMERAERFAAAIYESEQQERLPKYGNRKVEGDGIVFDSQHEYRVYRWLKERQWRGELRWVFVHVPFRFMSGVVYWADFMTIRADGSVEAVWDAKSEITAKNRDYVIKKKTLKAEWGIEICEVYQRDADGRGGFNNPAWPVMGAGDGGNRQMFPRRFDSGGAHQFSVDTGGNAEKPDGVGSP